MSLNHIRQAQQIAKENKLDGIDRAILFDIAADIGYDGSPAFPSYGTIAERTGYHKNTVANRVNGLIEAGLLIASKRGRSNQYTLPDCGMEFQEDEPHQKTQNVDVSMSERLTHLEKRLTHLEALLTHHRHIIDTSSTHENEKPTHHPPLIDTSLGVTEEEVRSKKLEETNASPPDDNLDIHHTLPSQPKHYQDFEVMNTKLTRNAETILGYLLDICHHIGRNKLPQARDLSAYLDSQGVNASIVKDALSGTAGYWRSQDWRGKKGDKPYLGQVETAVMEHVKMVKKQKEQGYQNTQPQHNTKRLWVKLKHYRQRIMDGTERMRAEEPSLYEFVSQNVDFWRAMAYTNRDFIDQKYDEFCTRWEIYQENVNQLTEAVTV